MPIVSRLDRKLGCTFVVWHGDVTPEEWHTNLGRVLSDPEFPPGRSWLVDARRANVDLLDEAELADMGRRMNEHADAFGGIRMAVLPNGNWGKARTLLEDEVTIQRLTAIQFTSFDTACVWLGLPQEEARAIVEELRNRAANANDV